MIKFIDNKVLGIGLLFLASVVPAQATLFTFTGTTASNITFAGTTAGSLVTGTFAVGIDDGFSSFPGYAGKPSTLLNVFLDYNAASPNVITVVESGTSYAGIAAGTTLLTINLSSALSLNAGATGVTINATGFTPNAATTTFFNDLGLDGAAVASNLSLNSIGLNGTFTASTKTLSAASNTLGISTPEPSTYLLFTGGLALVGFFNRKRLVSLKSK